MHDIIVGTLQERGIDIAVRHHACFGETGTEGHGMSFGDADIEDAIGDLFLHNTHRTAGRHGRRDADDLLVAFGKV